jgi:spore coat polysaccharide biosynthesis predicted glycosyltransferase SpsG
MGGADAANKTLTVLRALVELNCDTCIWVLLGEGYDHCYNALVETVRGAKRHEVILAKTNRSMWEVMGNCAVAILAGGLTTVEAIYAGLPSLNLFERPEHGEMLEELFDAGICVNAGLFSERALTTLRRTVQNLDLDRRRLLDMRERSRGLLDRHAGRRILAELERLLAERRAPRQEFRREPQPC